MKLALINLYFGKLPAYFPLWLASCQRNPSVDFFLFTDNTIQLNLPSNVNVVNMSFEEMIERINGKFPFEVKVLIPYKLTDFKPAYGYIFEDMLISYDYWGYCDLDLIFGNIMKFVEPPMRDGKKKIYQKGHLTIYKNIESMRTLFMRSGARFSYKSVYSDSECYAFDEYGGLIPITNKQSVEEYYQEDMADISCRINRLTASRQTNYDYQVFYYENGKVYRAYIENDVVRTQEYIYIHIQKRKYQFDGAYDCFFILSNRFVEKQPGIPSADEIRSLSQFVSEAEDHLQLKRYNRMKMREFLSSSVKRKWIWLNEKLSEKMF